MKQRPSDAAYRAVGHVLARLYRTELERPRDDEREQQSKDAA